MGGLIWKLLTGEPKQPVGFGALKKLLIIPITYTNSITISLKPICGHTQICSKGHSKLAGCSQICLGKFASTRTNYVTNLESGLGRKKPPAEAGGFFLSYFGKLLALHLARVNGNLGETVGAETDTHRLRPTGRLPMAANAILNARPLGRLGVRLGHAFRLTENDGRIERQLLTGEQLDQLLVQICLAASGSRNPILNLDNCSQLCLSGWGTSPAR